MSRLSSKQSLLIADATCCSRRNSGSPTIGWMHRSLTPNGAPHAAGPDIMFRDTEIGVRYLVGAATNASSVTIRTSAKALAMG